jgi:hypothetical protein
MSLSLFVDSDNLIRLDALKLAADDSYVNDATVTFTLKDAGEATVPNVAAVSMPYVLASDGRYQGTLQSTVSLALGGKYFLEVTATSGANVLFKRVTCYAVYKEAPA